MRYPNPKAANIAIKNGPDKVDLISALFRGSLVRFKTEHSFHDFYITSVKYMVGDRKLEETREHWEILCWNWNYEVILRYHTDTKTGAIISFLAGD